MTQLDWGIFMILCVAIGGLIGVLWGMAKKEREQWRLNRAIQERKWNEGGKEFLWIVLALGLAAPLPAQATINYDIVYVRVPRYGDGSQPGDRVPRMPDVANALALEPGSELMLLRSDGEEEVLVSAGPQGAILDPSMSFDGQTVYYSACPDVTPIAGIPRMGCDLWKVHIASRQTTQLTHGEWTPPEGAAPAHWCQPGERAGAFNSTCNTGGGRYNTGPAQLPGGKVVFTSSRNNYRPLPSTLQNVNMHLFVLDEATGITEEIGFLNVGGALHPMVLKNGAILFASGESQGRRDARLWGLWTIYPDGRHWNPSLSAFLQVYAAHFHAELSDGTLTTTLYYLQNNRGLGTLLQYAPTPLDVGRPYFGDPSRRHISNPKMPWGCSAGGPFSIPFSPQGLLNLTPFANAEDRVSTCFFSDGTRMGKVGHPRAAPGNGLLLSYSPGPAHNFDRPFYDLGIYYAADGRSPIDNPQTDLELVKAGGDYNRLQPVPVVPYTAIYGIAEPATLPYLPRQDARLLPGEAAGLIGTSSMCHHNADPALDNVAFVQQGSNWGWQGASIGAGRYTCADIFAVRLLALAGPSIIGSGPGTTAGPGWSQKRGVHEEHHRILGEVLLQKRDAAGNLLKDAAGNIDTSFLAKIPADTPFTFQTLDQWGRPLNHAQTWHQVRSGEKRNDCGGCHAHAQLPFPFEGTAASRPEYIIADLTKSTPLLTPAGIIATRSEVSVSYEFTRDIVPILTRLGMQTDYVQASATSQAYNAHDSGMYAAVQAAGGTPDELLTIARWISLGLPKDLGRWELDELRPALAMELDGGMLWIGANDDHTGVEIESLAVTVDGQSVTPRYMGNNRWSMPFTSPGRVRATVDDNQTNRAVLERVVTLQPPVIPTPQQVITQARDLLLNLGDDTEASCEGVEALRVLLSENEAVCQ